MHRRQFLAAAAATLATSGLSAAPPRARFVTSDVGPLKKVLVHTPGSETEKGVALGGGDHPLLPFDLMGPEAPEQHRSFVALLKRDGAEVLELEDVLADAIARARAEGQFVDWLGQAAPRLVPHEAEVGAAALLGAADRFVYHAEPDGGFLPLTDPLKYILYTRDLAVMTPKGVILGQFINKFRAFEAALIRFLFEWSDALRGYPILFDATAERVFLQGGDVIVADRETLFVGVGNLTEEAAARKLAQRLGMNVVAVQMPLNKAARTPRSLESWNGLCSQFLHLDTIFSLIAPRVALTVPYFLEAKFAGSDPLTEFARGVADLPRVSRAYMDGIAANLASVGLVKRFKARSGDLDSAVKGMKLLDYLREQGYEIHYVGGPPPEDDAIKHIVERVMREVRFQAGNVVATGPNRVLAYDGNAHTLAALREGGVEVTAFRATELARWYGGPHCLTLPLERGEARR